MATTTEIIRVATDPPVDLFTTRTNGPAARTLLVIHGGPDWDHSYLLEPLCQLGEEFQVIFVDLRGCGRSTRGLVDSAYTPDAVVSDLVALLDQLQLPTVDILGFSYGGLIAQRLLVAIPQRIRRVIIASSSVLPVNEADFGHWPEREARQQAERQVWNDPSLSGADLTRAAALAGAAANVWRAESLSDYTHRLQAIAFSGDWMRPWLAGILPSPRLNDIVNRLQHLATPILLLHGRQDMTYPAILAERTLPLLPAARAVVLDDAGHMAHIDQPAAWLQAVRDFLA